MCRIKKIYNTAVKTQMMKKNIYLIFFGLSALATAQTYNGKVGVNTPTPTNTFHVKSASDPVRFEGLQESTNPLDAPVVTDATGVLKRSNFGRTKFAGYITANINFTPTISKINVGTEVLDILNEYDSSTGLYTCQESGLYFFEAEITYTTSGTDSWGDNRGVVGFADASTNKWISRFNFEGSNDDRSFFAKGVVKLIAGGRYYFGVAAPVNTTGQVIANPTGSTGTGIGSMFALTRIQ